MKLAVSFFYDVSTYFKYLKYVFISMIIIIILTVLSTITINNQYISSKVLNIATNIRQAEKVKYNLADISKMYGIFNKDSYYLKEIAKDNKAKEVKKENKNGELRLDVVDALDVISKNQNPNLNITDTPSVQKIQVYGTTILNYSSKREINILGLFDKNITLTKKSDPVFLYSTHTSESYSNSERYQFGYSSSYRTQDAKYNMLSVGSVFSKTLTEKGVKMNFDTTPHDYGSYEISYTNSRKTLQNAMNGSERIGLAIDMHRDALADLTNGPTVEINGVKVAKLMFVMGVGTNSYANEYWEDNLALAVQLMKLGEEMYPGLFRPMLVRNSKYNQDLVKYSFLIEVGTTGNTLEEAYFGSRCLANVINKFYNN